MCSRKIANGIANAVWVSQTEVVVPARSRSGKTVIVLSSHGIVQWAPLTYIRSSGISATCSGTASRATVPMNSPWRCLKSIQANAYAANAAKAIGMIVAGRAMAKELVRPCFMPPAAVVPRTWR